MRWSLVFLFVLASSVGLPVTPLRAAPRQTLRGHVPGVVPHLQPLGTLPATQSLDLAIGLPLRHTNDLARLLEDLYNPASTNYHRYLTPGQFTTRFCPTEADYQIVMSFATAHGLRVIATHPNRTLLDVQGSKTAIEQAFHVQLSVFQHPTEKRTFYAPDVEPSLDLSVPVLAIAGLNTYFMPHPAHLIRPVSGKSERVSPHLSTGSGWNASYMGNDFRAAYAPGVTLTGSGQAIGLFELDGYYPIDITNYETSASMSPVTLTNVLVDGVSGIPGYSGDSNANEEVAMDIEVASAMAPGIAQVIVYEGPLTSAGAYDTLNRMATGNAAKQLSSSWVIEEVLNGPTLADQIYLQFAAQGQSFFQASGDQGAYYSGIYQYADNPNTTIVGGTVLTTTGAGGAWVSETAWNDGYDSVNATCWASGGGVSSIYPIPAWQQGIDMSVNQGSSIMRNVPDVSMPARDIFVTADNGYEEVLSGTSAAAPLWAGFMALVNQQAVSLGYPAVGFLNPSLYAIGKGTGYAVVFHDITSGNNTNLTSRTKYAAVPGYDLCTGWGTPNGQGLINALAPPGLHMTLQTAIMSDVAGGNGNGAMDPGETIQETIVWTNAGGGVTASNLTATLMTAAVGVTLFPTTNAYPNIPILSATSNAVPFSYRLAKSVTAGTVVIFTNVIQSGGLAFTGVFSHTVGRIASYLYTTNTLAVTNTLTITANKLTSMTNQIALNSSAVLDDVNAGVRISMTRDKYLALMLHHPDGTALPLALERGGNSANYGTGTPPAAVTLTTFDDQASTPISSGSAPFANAYRPEIALSNLLGRAVNGAWILNVTDISTTSSGTLYIFSLTLATHTPQYVVSIFDNPPVASNQTLTVAAGVATNLVLRGSDVDGDTLTFQTNSLPQHGALSAFNTNSGAITYTATAGYTGTDSFTFLANDGYTNSAAATVTLQVTNNLRSLTITANSTNKTYGQTLTFGGMAFAASGLTNGDTVTNVSLSSPGATTTAAVAGSPYPIIPTNALGPGLTNYIITYVNGTLTVNRASQTITFPPIAGQLATNTVYVSATASSALTVTFAVAAGPALLNASSNLTFTNAGSVSVTAAQAGDANWFAAATLTNSFAVTRAGASVVLSNLTQVYNGAPRVVSATTAPTGLAVSITYNGSNTAPFRVGHYAVTGTVNEALYQGTTSGTLTVKAPPQTLLMLR